MKERIGNHRFASNMNKVKIMLSFFTIIQREKQGGSPVASASNSIFCKNKGGPFLKYKNCFSNAVLILLSGKIKVSNGDLGLLKTFYCLRDRFGENGGCTYAIISRVHAVWKEFGIHFQFCHKGMLPKTWLCSTMLVLAQWFSIQVKLEQ